MIDNQKMSCPVVVYTILASNSTSSKTGQDAVKMKENINAPFWVIVRAGKDSSRADVERYVEELKKKEIDAVSVKDLFAARDFLTVVFALVLLFVWLAPEISSPFSFRQLENTLAGVAGAILAWLVLKGFEERVLEGITTKRTIAQNSLLLQIVEFTDRFDESDLSDEEFNEFYDSLIGTVVNLELTSTDDSTRMFARKVKKKIQIRFGSIRPSDGDSPI